MVNLLVLHIDGSHEANDHAWVRLGHGLVRTNERVSRWLVVPPPLVCPAILFSQRKIVDEEKSKVKL